jgi:hypothetical protein
MVGCKEPQAVGAFQRVAFWASKALAVASVLSTMAGLGLAWCRIGFWPIYPPPLLAGAFTDFNGWSAAAAFLIPALAGLLSMVSVAVDVPVRADLWFCLRWGLLSLAGAEVFWFTETVLARWPR